MPSTPGGKIRYYRHLKGLTQAQLAAAAAGFFLTTIVRYENEQSPCNLEACSKVASALNIDASQLYDDYLLFISDGYGDKIKNIRKTLAATQREFAELIGVWPKTVREWEKERSVPFRNNVEAMISLQYGNSF